MLFVGSNEQLQVEKVKFIIEELNDIQSEV